VVEGDAGDAGFVAEPVEVVEDVLGVEGAAVAVEDVAAAGGDVAEGSGAGGSSRAEATRSERATHVLPAALESAAPAFTTERITAFARWAAPGNQQPYTEIAHTALRDLQARAADLGAEPDVPA
ncbi:hypothetical protein, partial [Kitasatospora sp. P5_F3]